MRQQRRWVVLAALAALMLTAAGCGGGGTEADSDAGATSAAATEEGAASEAAAPAGSEEAAASEPILIAAPLPLTGPAAPYGTSYLSSLEITIDRINAGGGIQALGGRPIELLVADDEGNPERGPELIRQLQGQGAVAALGPLTSSAVLATQQTLDELEIPLVSPAMDTVLTEEGNGIEYYFRILQPAEVFGQQAVEFLGDQVDAGAIELDTVGVIAPNIPPGTSVSASLQEELPSLGVELEVIEYDPANTRDYAPFVSQLRDADVDLVTGHLSPSDAALFAEAIALQDWRPSQGFLWIAGGYSLNAGIEAAGPTIANWMVVNFTAPESDVEITRDLAAEYEASSGLPFDAMSGSAPASAGALAAALEQVDEVSGPAIRDALRELEYSGGENYYTMAGGVDFDERGNNIAWRAAITQHDGQGNQIAVYPEDIAVREPTWPAHDLGT